MVVKHKTLSQWLSYIESLHPEEEIDLGLSRIQQVAESLQLTQPAKLVITVAGTNGKGSSVAFLQSILLSAGYKVGAFTSPHFIRYNERVLLNGEEVADQLLCDAFERIENGRGEISLTYFEIGTLAALDVFCHSDLDVVILEVGLGGRLDAVNIIDADVSLVTTVSIDHEDWLGSDREVIGFEKSGIFRAHKPAVCGDINMPASVQTMAESLPSPLYARNKAFNLQVNSDDTWNWQGKDLSGESVQLQDLPASHLPLANAAAVLQVIYCSGLSVAEAQIKQGLANATLTGRYQQLTNTSLPVILDVAHNPEAAAYLAGKLASNKDDFVNTHAVVAMLADKDSAEVFSLLADQVDQWHVAELQVPRAQSIEVLAKHVEQAGGQLAGRYSSVKTAYQQALSQSGKQDRVIVFGSFYTIAEVLAVVDAS